jgi:O-antigen/teichoic acid export membrane protein
MVEILVPLGFFAMVVAIIYLLVRKKERLALIQNGADASTLKMDKTSNDSLKFGLLLIGIALGILLGNLLAEYASMQEEVAYFSMTFICGGISLLIYYVMNKKQNAEDELKRGRE